MDVAGKKGSAFDLLEDKDTPDMYELANNVAFAAELEGVEAQGLGGGIGKCGPQTHIRVLVDERPVESRCTPAAAHARTPGGVSASHAPLAVTELAPRA